jgi:hypothetical protein
MWNCAEDADVSDDDEECLQHWPPSLFVDGNPRRPDQRYRRAGLLGWDVTEDVSAGAYAWAILAASRTQARPSRRPRQRLPSTRGRRRAARAIPGADPAVGAGTGGRDHRPLAENAVTDGARSQHR